MTISDLEQGKKIVDKMQEARRVLEHLQRFKSGVDNPVEFVANYLTECRNVGSESTRKSLALGFLEDSKKFLETTIKMLQEDLNKL